MIYENFSEKQILDGVRRESHLGQGIKRLSLRIVRCTEDYFEQGNLIYQKGKEYKLWIVKYSDILLGITKWFTAEPKIIDDGCPQYDGAPHRTFFMVPLETFIYAEESPKAVCFEFQIPISIKYQLFVDINDGMQYLIEPWSLEKSAVIEYARKIYGGATLDYNIRGRYVCNKDERHIVWLLRQYLGKKQSQDLFFDVLRQQFIAWDMYRDDASMSPISSGQAMIHIGSNTVKADKFRMHYKLVK